MSASRFAQIDEWLALLADGAISDEDAESLRAAIVNSAEAEAYVAKAMRMESELRSLSRSFDAEALVRGVAGALFALDDEARFLQVFAARQQREEKKKRSLRAYRYAAWTAIAGVALCAALVLIRNNQPVVLATLTSKSPGARTGFARQEQRATVGEAVRAGAWLQTFGNELSFDTVHGAWGTLASESRLSFPDPQPKRAQSVRLESGAVTFDLSQAHRPWPLLVVTPYATLSTQNGAFVTSVSDGQTRVDVWSGIVFMRAQSPNAIVSVQQGQYAATNGSIKPEVMLQSGWSGTNVSKSTDDVQPRSAGKAPQRAEVSMQAQALLLPKAPAGPGEPAKGKPTSLAWDQFVAIGSGRWQVSGNELVQQTVKAEEGYDEQHYAAGIVNMGQLPIDESGDLVVRALVQMQSAAPGAWNAGLLLLFEETPTTLGCYFSSRPGQLSMQLEAFKDERLRLSPIEESPRTPLVADPSEPLWVELSVHRPELNDSSAEAKSRLECRVWRQADARPPVGLEGRLVVHGNARRVGFRTYRASVRFSNVEVSSPQ